MNNLDIKNGTLYSTSDLNLALHESEKLNSKIMLIDDISTTYQNPRIIRAGILLPPYDAMCAFDNNNENDFISIYQFHIITSCTKIIASMIGCMMNNYNILLYIPEHIYREVSYLLLHMQNLHGIICGNESTPFYYNESYNDFNIGFLYKLNYISPEEYLYKIKDMNFINDPDIIQKLISELNPVLSEYTIQKYYDYFINFSKLMKNNNNVLNCPIYYKGDR